jgi:hypothetical protein
LNRQLLIFGGDASVANFLLVKTRRKQRQSRTLQGRRSS